MYLIIIISSFLGEPGVDEIILTVASVEDAIIIKETIDNHRPDGVDIHRAMVERRVV